MIHIIPKPTDTPDDNSTGMVMDALRKMGVPFEVLDLASVPRDAQAAQLIPVT